MSARLAISLAAAAVMLSAAALAVALMALTKQPPVSSGSIIESPIASAPAKDEPAEYTKSLVSLRIARQRMGGRYWYEGMAVTRDGPASPAPAKDDAAATPSHWYEMPYSGTSGKVCRRRSTTTTARKMLTVHGTCSSSTTMASQLRTTTRV